MINITPAALKDEDLSLSAFSLLIFKGISLEEYTVNKSDEDFFIRRLETEDEANPHTTNTFLFLSGSVKARDFPKVIDTLKSWYMFDGHSKTRLTEIYAFKELVAYLVKKTDLTYDSSTMPDWLESFFEEIREEPQSHTGDKAAGDTVNITKLPKLLQLAIRFHYEMKWPSPNEKSTKHEKFSTIFRIAKTLGLADDAELSKRSNEVIGIKKKSVPNITPEKKPQRDNPEYLSEKTCESIFKIANPNRN